MRTPRRNPRMAATRRMNPPRDRPTGSLSPLTAHRSRPSNPDELRPPDELGADGAVVGVGPAGLRVGPGESAAHRGIVRLVVDGAPVLHQEHAAAPPHPGAPLAP